MSQKRPKQPISPCENAQGIAQMSTFAQQRSLLVFTVLIIIISAYLYPLRAFGEERPAYNIVFISIDTLAADHLGIYGHSKDTSPFIDRLAKESILFESAFSNACYTLPSHLSMFTGVYPAKHKVIDPDGTTVLRPSIRTLPELLKAEGYTTLWFAPTEEPHLYLKWGFGRGIDETLAPGLYEHKIPHLFTWLTNNREHKFFAFLHTYIVHDPYTPPQPFYDRYAGDYKGKIVGERSKFLELVYEFKPDHKFEFIDGRAPFRQLFWSRVDFNDPKDIEHLRALYEAEIRYVDTLVEKVVHKLKELQISDKTVIILTSDHGEAFGQHGRFLHNSLHHENLHVPLILKIPHMPPAKVKQQVQSIDIVPTILDYLGLPVPHYMEGRSLLPLAVGETGTHHEYTFAEHWGTFSIRSHEWKLIVEPNRLRELYNIAADPYESNNVADLHSDIVMRLKRELDGFIAQHYQSD
jgi:arylsulfatase A-like enzyme